MTSRWKDSSGRWDGGGCLGFFVLSGGTRIVSRKFKYAQPLELFSLITFQLQHSQLNLIFLFMYTIMYALWCRA